MVRRRAAKTIDELLAQARAALPDRPSPAQALHAQAGGALLIDIRDDDQRRQDGLIPGAIVLPRNSLEWRCDPRIQVEAPCHHPPGPAHHPHLQPGIPIQPGRSDPAATWPHPRHRPGRRIHRLDRSRPASDQAPGASPPPHIRRPPKRGRHAKQSGQPDARKRPRERIIYAQTA
jgi:rhodanese-related sulfurtransferase